MPQVVNDKLLLACLGIALGLAWLFVAASRAGAQYPPPGSTLVILPGSSNIVTGSTIGLTVRVSDPQARPVQGSTVTCRLTAGTENGASLGSSEATGITDVDGKATFQLFTGTKAGTVVVRCQSPPAVGQMQLQVRDGSLRPGPSRLPATGQGESSGGPFLPLWALAGLGVGALAVLAIGATFILSRNR